jgi:hypothetical protein
VWSPWQLELAMSDASAWKKAFYPDNGDHDHCALTWETIAAYGDYIHEAYTNGSDWITPDAFNRYIVGNEAHVRKQKP